MTMPSWYVIAKEADPKQEDEDDWTVHSHRRSPAINDKVSGIIDDEDMVHEFVSKMDEIMGSEAWVRIAYPSGKYSNMTVWFGDYWQVNHAGKLKWFRAAAGSPKPASGILRERVWGFSGPSCGMCFQSFETKDEMLRALQDAILDQMDNGVIVFGQEPRTQAIYDSVEKKIKVEIS